MNLARSEAVDQLVEHDLDALTASQRNSLLADWWPIGAGDPGFDELPPALRQELARAEAPSGTDRALFDPLLRVALRARYLGTLTSFLERRLAADFGISARVVGSRERLQRCPCCGFHTLDARGAYEICAACFWEDDGGDRLDAHSGPNHMTLREAQANFARLGAVHPDLLARVVANPGERFASDSSGSDD